MSLNTYMINDMFACIIYIYIYIYIENESHNDKYINTGRRRD